MNDIDSIPGGASSFLFRLRPAESWLESRLALLLHRRLIRRQWSLRWESVHRILLL
jgi:hypothetical protein